MKKLYKKILKNLNDKSSDKKHIKNLKSAYYDLLKVLVDTYEIAQVYDGLSANKYKDRVRPVIEKHSGGDIEDLI